MEENITKKDLIDEFKKHTGILSEEFKSNLGFVIDQQDMRKGNQGAQPKDRFIRWGFEEGSQPKDRFIFWGFEQGDQIAP